MPEQSRAEELRTMSYERYLQTPEWQERRQEALERAENRCQVCYGSDSLDVHHRTYERRGSERPGDLTVLCRSCHYLFHGMQNVKRLATPFTPIEDALGAAEIDLEQRYAKRGAGFGIPLGFRDLELLLHGLEPGDLFVLAGRPQARADLLSFNIALHAAKHQHVTFLFSFSHTQEQLTRQLVAIKSLVSSDLMRRGWIDEDDWERTISQADAMAEYPLFLCTDIGLTPHDIRAHLLEYLLRAKESGERETIDFIVIDGMSLLEYGGAAPRESTYQQMLQTVRSLKLLAREFQAPLLLTCSLSPQVESRDRFVAPGGDQPHFFSPQISDLQPSGIFEQFADIIGFISPDNRYVSSGIGGYLAEIAIAQNRHGAIGRGSVYYSARWGIFRDLEEASEEELKKSGTGAK
jgi:replicative DNA helicase